MLKSLTVGVLASLSIVGCGKDTPAGRAGDELDKQATEAQLRGGDWYAACDSTNLIAAVVGINSSREVLDFDGTAERRFQYFSDAACTNLIGTSVYTGTADVGPATTKDSNARIIDMNFMNVTISFADQATVDSINGNPLLPGCGINDFKVNEPRDVTANAGGLNCPYVSKPAPRYDILKTDGRTLNLGLNENGLDGSTQEKRPLVIDPTVRFEKK